MATKNQRSKSARPQPKRTGGRPGGRLRQPVVVARRATWRDWVAGARLRTLSLAIAPVAIGTAAAVVAGGGGWHWVRALLALVVAASLQIGVNFANDYSDGIRGTDAHRVGPSRLTGSGAANPRTVLSVALAFFGLGAIAGLVLVILSGQYWLLAVGALALVAAWFYTGGKRPYGYSGFGEIVVFLFFGLVATAGTSYVQIGAVPIESWVGGAAVGFLAAAVLMVNNLRDIEQDSAAGKRTLAVRVGDRRARALFVLFLLVPFGILVGFGFFYELAPLVFFTLLAAAPAAVITIFATTPRELILSLQLTSFTALIFGLGLAAAIAF